MMKKTLERLIIMTKLGTFYGIGVGLGDPDLLTVKAINAIKKVDVLITLDNYLMHAARLVHTPTIALFGPTEASRYGYNEHFCIQADLSKCDQSDKCLGPHVSENYDKPCPLCEEHCMNTHDEAKIVDITMSIINKK